MQEPKRSFESQWSYLYLMSIKRDPSIQLCLVPGMLPSPSRSVFLLLRNRTCNLLLKLELREMKDRREPQSLGVT